MLPFFMCVTPQHNSIVCERIFVNCVHRKLCHRSKYWVVTANAWAIFLVCSFCVTNFVKFRLLKKKNNNAHSIIYTVFIRYSTFYGATYSWRKHASSKPYGVSLHVMWNHLNINRLWLEGWSKSFIFNCIEIIYIETFDAFKI